MTQQEFNDIVEAVKSEVLQSKCTETPDCPDCTILRNIEKCDSIAEFACEALTDVIINHQMGKVRALCAFCIRIGQSIGQQEAYKDILKETVKGI